MSEDRDERRWRVFTAWEAVRDRRRGEVWKGGSLRLDGPGVATMVGLAAVPLLAYLDSGFWSDTAGSGATESGASLVCHLVAFLGMTLYFAERARRAGFSRAGTLGLCLLSLAWLPPVPLLPLVGFLSFVFVDVEARERTLVHEHFARRTAMDSLAIWRRLKDALRRRWERARWWRRLAGPPRGLVREPADPGLADAHLTDFYRVRSLSLPLETAWAAWTSLRLAGGDGLGAAVRSTSVAALILGLAGLTWTAAGFFRRLLHATAAPTSRDRHSAARAFAFTQLGFAAGLQVGEGLHLREPLAIAAVAGAAGLLGMVVLFGPLLLEILRPVPELSRMDVRQELPWLLLCPLLLAVSLRFSSTAGLERDWRVLQALIEVAPLLALFPGLAHLDWLLRPYAARNMFSRELPARARATLAFLTFTGLLPLGGLALPAWIGLRRRGWPPR